MTIGSEKPQLWIVVGPTASGKTALAIALSKCLNTEIISFDSRQFYTEMTIGTAKPSASELAQAPHHFISSKSIQSAYSSGSFAKDAKELLSASKKKNLVLVGGSGLYLNALLYPFHSLPAINDDLRNSVIKLSQSKGIEWLKGEVQRLDPISFKKMDTQNPQRLTRILEVCLQTGMAYSEVLRLQDQKKELPYEIKVFGIDWPRDLLYERINSRVDTMMQMGLLEEVKNLVDFQNLKALQTVGYVELFRHLDGQLSLDEAVDLIKRNSRRYAKRQLTWFRNQNPTVEWHSYKDLDSILTKAENHSTTHQE